MAPGIQAQVVHDRPYTSSNKKSIKISQAARNEDSDRLLEQKEKDSKAHDPPSPVKKAPQPKSTRGTASADLLGIGAWATSATCGRNSDQQEQQRIQLIHLAEKTARATGKRGISSPFGRYAIGAATEDPWTSFSRRL
jgi:hypothetical protein